MLRNSARVEYLVVGRYALAAHGHPRYTGDLDIGLEDFRTNKRADGRAKDLADLASLDLPRDA